MWNCPHCGCQNILDVPFCPQCFIPRDVAAEPGQASEGSGAELVGSPQPGPESGTLTDVSDAGSPPPKTAKAARSKSGAADWGKE